MTDKKVTINTKNGDVNMTIPEITRWFCLLEAIDSIEKKCEKQGMNMDNVDWIKPIALQKYIDERYHSMLHDVTVEHKLGNL